ncbi:MAG TPA: nickel-responsive transcriptional regulator NikR [Candidatus Limnocylindrales bacterium]|nr:nickel-responsive transcriptional regulator NikR [Candidatus Limnocylindrales bacterium]
MANLVRFAVSINSDLLAKFDKLIEEKSYVNRSEAIRDLIRNYIVESEWESDEETVGVVTIVYNHHIRELTDKLADIQHAYNTMINSALHVHLDSDNCLEAIVVKGKSSEIEKFAYKLIGIKGVKHGQLTKTTSGKDI